MGEIKTMAQIEAENESLMRNSRDKTEYRYLYKEVTDGVEVDSNTALRIADSCNKLPPLAVTQFKVTSDRHGSFLLGTDKAGVCIYVMGLPVEVSLVGSDIVYLDETLKEITYRNECQKKYGRIMTLVSVVIMLLLVSAAALFTFWLKTV